MFEQTKQYSSKIDSRYTYAFMINLHTSYIYGEQPENHVREDDQPVCILLL